MTETSIINGLINSGEWEFRKLTVSGVDNTSVLAGNQPDMAGEQTCLFHQHAESGDEYVEQLHAFIATAVENRSAAPVVRFADGEFAFYAENLHCNGLYKQAESVASIKEAKPLHAESMAWLGRFGKLAPLVFPGNIVHPKKPWWIPWAGRNRRANSAEGFLSYMERNGVTLTPDNYIPFYVVYAYLTSARFARLLDGRTVGLINSECRMDACLKWFSRFDSRIDLRFISIPPDYMATRWSRVKDRVLAEVEDSAAEICLVGAGIGSLLICVDVARHCSISAIDAGHVVNMLNGLEEKSNGPRLYTIHLSEQ